MRQPAEHNSTKNFKMKPFISPEVTETYHSRLKGSRHSGAADLRTEMTMFEIHRPTPFS